MNPEISNEDSSRTVDQQIWARAWIQEPVILGELQINPEPMTSFLWLIFLIAALSCKSSLLELQLYSHLRETFSCSWKSKILFPKERKMKELQIGNVLEKGILYFSFSYFLSDPGICSPEDVRISINLRKRDHLWMQIPIRNKQLFSPV